MGNEGGEDGIDQVDAGVISGDEPEAEAESVGSQDIDDLLLSASG